jgi:phosphoglycolate phosphatase
MTALASLPRTVLFDLDGTLVDTGPDLTAALNHALGVLGRPVVDEDSVKEMVGLGARKLLERGLEATGAMTPELVDAGVQPFLDYYADNICVGSRPYDGIEAAMDMLAAEGVTLAVCTNKPQRLSRLLIAALGWDGRFAAIVGADSVPQRKPHPDHVLATIEAARGDVRSTAFVGDSIVDVTAARAARVPVVAVSFGFPDRPAETLGADAVIDRYDELVPTLRRLGASATW